MEIGYASCGEVITGKNIKIKSGLSTVSLFPAVLADTHVEGHDNAEQRETFPPVLDDTHATKLQLCESKTAEKEKQLFSPKAKGVVDDMATEVGLNAEVSVANAPMKRGILFGDSLDEENNLHAEKTYVPAHEISLTAAGFESPIKKLKNVIGHI